MKDGVVLANAGHFDVEIDVDAIYAIGRPALVRPNVDRINVNGNRLFLLSKGRVVNLVAGEGHPPEVMALSFANQLMSILYVAKNYDKVEIKVQSVPEKIDNRVAVYALDAMAIRIDEMTKEQKLYRVQLH